MKRHYFIMVRPYLSVSKMGLELGEYVDRKYNHVVVSADDFEKVKDDIREKMKELKEKYPRSKSFKMLTVYDIDRYEKGAPYIYVTPQSQYNDNHIFVLNTEVIRNEVKVVSKGGTL